MKKSKQIIACLFLFSVIAVGFSIVNLLPTSLKITVVNELGNIVEGASVRLYTSDDDYRSEENVVGNAQFTDKKGRTTFKKLESIVYFVNVEKGDKNNDGAGVQTDSLKTGVQNKVTIVIE